MHMVSLTEIHEAQSRLHGIIIRTPLIEFTERMWGQPSAVRPGEARRLFLKPENQQPIGAFKLR